MTLASAFSLIGLDPALAGSAVLAGFAYGITPGPGVLAVFGIGADRGRPAGARFLTGHIAGDFVWYALALASIVGASTIGDNIFRVLGLASGAYLIWLGFSAIRQAGRAAGEAQGGLAAGRPLMHGLVFGLTNPKSYPVAAAMFTALLAGNVAALGWKALPGLIVMAIVGSVLAYGVLVFVVGLPSCRRFYRRHEAWIVRLCGAMFVAFGSKSILDSLRR